MKLVRNILLYSAMILLLLHHLLPHQHHGQLATAMHQKEHHSTNFTDILRTFFHEIAPNIDAGQYQESREKNKIILRAVNTQSEDFTAQLFHFTRLFLCQQRTYYAHLLAHYQQKNTAFYQACIKHWHDFKATLPLYYNTCVGFRAPPPALV